MHIVERNRLRDCPCDDRLSKFIDSPLLVCLKSIWTGVWQERAIVEYPEYVFQFCEVSLPYGSDQVCVMNEHFSFFYLSITIKGLSKKWYGTRS